MVEMNFLEKVLVNSRIYNFFYRRTLLKEFLDFCRLEGKTLELGCGAGFTSGEIKKRFAVELTATDYDMEQVEKAVRRLAGTGINVMRADATALPFPDGTFDCVVEMNAFHHIRGYRKAVREAYRVLKKGGRLSMMDVSRYFLWPFSKLIPFESFEGKFTKRSMMAEMEAAGFRVARHRHRDFFFIECEKS